jgi:hypothetical protein
MWLHSNHRLVRRTGQRLGARRASRERACPPQRSSARAASQRGCLVARRACAIDCIVDAIAQGFATELDAVGVVNDALEDGVGEGGITDDVVPLRAILDDFEQIAALFCSQDLGPMRRCPWSEGGTSSPLDRVNRQLEATRISGRAGFLRWYHIRIFGPDSAQKAISCPR